MDITEKVIPHIEKAVGLKLYDEQKRYLLNKHYHINGGRGVGRTVAYCIKLALSGGEPLNMSEPWEFSDYGDGSKKYAKFFFIKEFMRYRQMLKDYGFPVREVKYYLAV
ncbi:hypothetical protein [Bacillus mesophilum]|uniref:Uncharacterized protein n=1 Tax=Bacillus mesophilum TaxID=1071718 RepID=A0A7V7RNW0_9BACI|nr:hypothetical protein [Bacillus mesophilum]KAB2334283.1 hypothetical protein F7732_09440 [Bacillus mesophilum]